MAGNKSGGLLLTTFVLKPGAVNKSSTKRRAASAFQDGDGQVGEAGRSVAVIAAVVSAHSGSVTKSFVASGSDFAHAVPK